LDAAELAQVDTSTPLGTNDTIAFDPQVFNAAQAITLNGSELQLTANLTITGPGANLLSISGNNASQVFTVHSGITATISGLTLTSGRSATNGGDLNNAGTLTLNNDVIQNGTATQSGGDIFSNGTLTLNSCTVTSGTASSLGGDLLNSGILTLYSCTVSGGSAHSSAGGGVHNSGTLTITNSTLSGNTAHHGGALSNSSTGTVLLSNDTLASNSATGTTGGAINSQGTLTLTNVTVADNFAATVGGGIDTTGSLTLTNSIIAGNHGTDPDVPGAVVSSSANNVTATLNGLSNQTVTIPLSFGGTASGSDYTASAASITIAVGQTTGSITLTGANSPNFGTSPQTVTVSIAGVTNGLAGSPSSVSLTIAPDPNSAYVSNCYHLLLGRAPDPAGFRGWVSLLNSGLSPSALVRGIEASAEFLGDVVEALYARYLGRAADPAGLAAWSGQLAAGVSPEQVAADILASPEYLADHNLTPAPGQSPYLGSVQGLYQQVLGRAGTPSEWAIWTRALDGGSLTPGQVALEMLTSPEYETDLVNGEAFHYAPLWEGFYPEFLHRAADPTGLAGWVAALRSGMSDQAVLAGILGSAEGYRDWS
jgi:predicted outer membrane repeat protein